MKDQLLTIVWICVDYHNPFRTSLRENGVLPREVALPICHFLHQCCARCFKTSQGQLEQGLSNLISLAINNVRIVDSAQSAFISFPILIESPKKHRTSDGFPLRQVAAFRWVSENGRQHETAQMDQCLLGQLMLNFIFNQPLV